MNTNAVSNKSAGNLCAFWEVRRRRWAEVLQEEGSQIAEICWCAVFLQEATGCTRAKSQPLTKTALGDKVIRFSWQCEQREKAGPHWFRSLGFLASVDPITGGLYRMHTAQLLSWLWRSRILGQASRFQLFDEYIYIRLWENINSQTYW